MGDRRTALFGAVAWWFARRWMRRRASMAVAGIATGVAAQRSRLRAVVAAFVIVGALAAAFIAWRKLFARADEASDTELLEASDAPSVPTPGDGSVATVGADST
ncbi:MAG TPA: hypothetical protein VHH57_04425 [Gaiella sp.]|jgi:hypothetical protein|nr:hypothetical protein [Gaiella sp.]